MSRFAFLAALVLAVATPLAAQNAPTAAASAALAAPNAAPAAPAALAPRIDRAGVGVRHSVAAPEAVPALKRSDTNRNRALLIVGGAALLVGAAIGHDNNTAGSLIMVSGAVVGLYGMYKFLQ